MIAESSYIPLVHRCTNNRVKKRAGSLCILGDSRKVCAQHISLQKPEMELVIPAFTQLSK